MIAVDARCLACGRVHVIWVAPMHEAGETIGYADRDGCGEVTDHEIVSKLDGLSGTDKWDDGESA